MRRIFIFLTFMVFFLNSFSQRSENETLTIKFEKKFTKSPWGMKFGIGALYHQMPGQDHIKNQLALAGSISLYHKQFFIRSEIFSVDFKPKDPIDFDNYEFSTEAEFNSMNLNMELGYGIDFDKQWGSELRVGINITDFSLLNDDEFGFSYSSDMITGTILGVTLNRYFEFSEFRFLEICLNVDYYTTNYSSISRDLSRGSLNCSLTAAFKFWFHHNVSLTPETAI